jgi:1-aminocyclopropane-1-carboxylate deaminase/D-cysteine desulfhydrase-like pyridoxal-dependent ACC family enzyme
MIQFDADSVEKVRPPIAAAAFTECAFEMQKQTEGQGVQLDAIVVAVPPQKPREP